MEHKAQGDEETAMPTAKRTLRIQAPRERVWDFATDPRNLTAYIHGAQRVEPITSLREALGAQWRQTNVYGPLVVVNVYEVTEAERPERWVLETTTRPHVTLSLDLQQTEDGSTEATLEIEAELPGNTGKLAQPYVGEWAIESIVRRSIETLKRKVEREQREKPQREARS